MKGYASSLQKLPMRPCPQCGCEYGYLCFTEPDYGSMWACAECDHKFPGSQEHYSALSVGGENWISFWGSGLGLNEVEFDAWIKKQGLTTCPKCGYRFSPTTARNGK